MKGQIWKSFLNLRNFRYIGGCCGFEPYHIRAMAEELRAERGKLPEASKKSEFARDLFMAKKRAELNPAVYAERYALFSCDFWKLLLYLKQSRPMLFSGKLQNTGTI